MGYFVLSSQVAALQVQKEEDAKQWGKNNNKNDKVNNKNGRGDHEFGERHDDFETSGKIPLREYNKGSDFISISVVIKATGVDKTTINREDHFFVLF